MRQSFHFMFLVIISFVGLRIIKAMNNFNNISYFNRVFKKETGVSPRVFRENNKA